MIIALFMSVLVAGQDPCDGDFESAACAAAQIAAATRELSLPDIQTDLDGGAEIYRAVFDADSLFPLPAVSFERRLGRSPELVVYGAGGRPPLRREIGADVWRTVQQRSRYAGRQLERDERRILQCYISSTAVVQIARPHLPKLGETHRVITRPISVSQNSCEGGLTWDFAAFLSDLACGQIPECDAMGDRSHFTQAVWHLEGLSKLRGDRLAAASLYTDSGRAPLVRRSGEPLNEVRVAEWLRPEDGATLEWGGTRVRAARAYDDEGPDAISRFIAQQDASVGELSFHPAEFGAESGEVGWVTGTVEYSVQAGSAWQSYEAEYRQTWLGSEDHWRLWTMTVGQFDLRPAGPEQEAAVAGQ